MKALAPGDRVVANFGPLGTITTMTSKES
jgi:preprotein translocase subunit YajC